ncbi:SRPBCC family protein [Aeromicrobium sp. SMF47]|uniref:SRPBCC family protein n=1 Tax=Aeromicrobium TaxID=2040 RepID=UPI0013BF1F76|nr:MULTISPECIES: SRPBCC family protein [Aeromicrobium]MRJ77475.1 SRPBCC family protein [Aeromicrobium yanjiei]MRK01842.1 SRPBCC family protein [Aeromicrobium sp. S22]
MALIEIVREVRLPPAEAFARLTTWERHGDHVPLTRITRTPDGFDAFTGVGRIGFHDPMDVVQWREPSFCRLEKRGRVVTGWAELSVDPIDGGSRVTWREDIHVTGMPRLMDAVTRASSRRLFSRVIDGLLA